MANELKQNSGKIGDYLKNIMLMPETRVCGKLNLRFRDSSVTGQALTQKTAQKRIGGELGRIGLIMLSNGQEVIASIQTGRGMSHLPLLTSQQKLSLSAAESLHEGMISTYANPDDYQLPKICPEDLENWGKVYIQGMAALESAQIEAVDALVGALRIKRPMQKMNVKDMKMFLKMTSKLLIEAEYGYFAIEQGIKDLLTKDEGQFFPTDANLRKYIHPVNFRFRRKMDLLGRMLEQS